MPSGLGYCDLVIALVHRFCAHEQPSGRVQQLKQGQTPDKYQLLRVQFARMGIWYKLSCRVLKLWKPSPWVELCPCYPAKLLTLRV